MHKPHLIILLYDSVTNSVFESQVLAPYHAKLISGAYAAMTIITYEKNNFNKSSAYQLFQKRLAHLTPHVTCLVLQRPLFLGIFSLWPCITPLCKLLDSFPEHVLIARGPISGYLARHAHSNKTQQLTIQARGLLYEEYCLATKHAPVWLRPFHTYRAYHYQQVERYAYSGELPPHTTIESVSTALGNHLKSYYHMQAPIILATHDTPPIVSESEQYKARIQQRTVLHIPHDAPVFVYNGSVKAWQCPDATFSYFKKRWLQDPRSILLFISQDLQKAQHIGTSYQLPTTAVRYVSVPHQEVMPLLCAADYGLLFREPHLINWTSRPTKLLEYQSAGLHIIHNNTVDILQNVPNSSYASVDYYPKEKE